MALETWDIQFAGTPTAVLSAIEALTNLPAPQRLPVRVFNRISDDVAALGVTPTEGINVFARRDVQAGELVGEAYRIVKLTLLL